MPGVVIVDAVRTPVGRRDGTLAHTHPIDMLGRVQSALFDRTGVDPGIVGQVVGGCVAQVGAQTGNIARTAWLSAGLPHETAATSLDSQCGSAQQALNLACALVASGVVDAAVGCGVENMSMVPMGSSSFDGTKAGHGKPMTRSYRRRYEYTTQFEAAERIAHKWGLSRSETDAFALSSQQRAATAIASDAFDDHIVSIEAVTVEPESGDRSSVLFSADETPRPTTIDGLSGLKPVLEDGLHTAGSSSQIADGAAAVLVVNDDCARSLGLKPRARVIETCLVGCDPVMMLEGPVPATEKVLKSVGMSVDDIDLFEVNEAFASIVLAWAQATGADLERTNVNGGAIALGHPLGATGGMLVAKILTELERRDAEWGLVTMCCGGGLGTGTLIQRNGHSS
jgi:acetyl-CoA C-acetyltransferase